MSAFDDAWNSLNDAIGAALTARNAVDPVAQRKLWRALDDKVTQLQKQCDRLTETAINQALANLSDQGALAKFQTIAKALNDTAESIKDAADKVAAVNRVVAAATALTAFALQLAA